MEQLNHPNGLQNNDDDCPNGQERNDDHPSGQEDNDDNNANGHQHNDSDHPFYTQAVEYWSRIPATVDGMLGGFGFISNTDIQGSKAFLKHLFKLKDAPGQGRVIDCGAGIGRITKHLLLQFFDKVDLVEQNPKFLEEAKIFIGPNKKVENFYSLGLQHFAPPPNAYDVIWCQWVLGHLTDTHFIDFFKSCSKGLKPNGVIVVKENLTSSDQVEIDEQDSSVTRPLYMLQALFERAGLKCMREAKQNNFPRGLYQVRMFALRPAVLIDSQIGDDSEDSVDSDNPAILGDSETSTHMDT